MRKGTKQSEEAKKKVSAANIGKVPWNRGKKTGLPGPKGKRWKLKDTSRFGHHVKGEKNVHWKGGISKMPGYQSWIKNKRNRVLKRVRVDFGSHTFGEWQTLKAQYGFTCPCCKRSEPEIKLTEDHIVPLSKGGHDRIENIQPLCMSCNARKHASIIKY